MSLGNRGILGVYSIAHIHWVLPSLSNSWLIHTIWLYIALNRTPNIDCYWVGAVPNIYTYVCKRFRMRLEGAGFQAHIAK